MSAKNLRRIPLKPALTDTGTPNTCGPIEAMSAALNNDEKNRKMNSDGKSISVEPPAISQVNPQEGTANVSISLSMGPMNSRAKTIARSRHPPPDRRSTATMQSSILMGIDLPAAQTEPDNHDNPEHGANCVFDRVRDWQR